MNSDFEIQPSRIRIILFILFCVALGLRLPGAISPPASGLYNGDEVEFLQSTLGLITGQTPMALQWPAGVLMFLFSPVIFVHFLITSPTAFSSLFSLDINGLITAITLYMGHTFYNPASVLLIGRLLVAVISATTPLWVVKVLNGYVSDTEKLMIATLIVTSPLLISETAILKGDSIGLMFWAIAAYSAIPFVVASPHDPPCKRKLIVAFLFLGLATAQRFTYAIVFPMLLAAVLAKLSFHHWDQGVPRKDNLRLVLLSMVAFIAPILVFVPFVWTHPFTTAKAFVGNVLLLSHSTKEFHVYVTLIKSLSGLVGLPAFLLASLGALVVWRQKGRLAGLALSLSFLIFIFPLWRSGYVAPRYTLALLPVLALWVSLGVRAAFEWLNGHFRFNQKIAMGVVLFLVLGWNVAEATNWFLSVRRPRPVDRTTNWLQFYTKPSDSIALPMCFRAHIPPNDVAVARIVNSYESHPGSAARRLNSLWGRSGLGMEASDGTPDFAISAVFGEDEAMDLFCYRTMLYAAGKGEGSPAARNVWYYQQGEPEKPDRISDRMAMHMFQSGQIGVLVTGEAKGTIESQGIVPAASFRPWFVYINHFGGKPIHLRSSTSSHRYH